MIVPNVMATPPIVVETYYSENLLVALEEMSKIIKVIWIHLCIQKLFMYFSLDQHTDIGILRVMPTA